MLQDRIFISWKARNICTTTKETNGIAFYFLSCRLLGIIQKVILRYCVQTNVVQNRGLDPKIQQARDYAVAQAQQDGCMANFKIIDSPFGNFLLPVIPTRAELNR